MCRTPTELDALRAAGGIVADVLVALERAIKPDTTTTAELDALAEQLCRERGGVPAFKGYRDFPASVCISVGAEVIHGLPSERILKAGEIVSLDFACSVDGFFADAAITVPVGEVGAEALRLIATTQAALYGAIAVARDGARIGDLGAAIQQYVEAQGFSVVRAYVGHGIGRKLHEAPPVPNCGTRGTGLRLTAGMALAVEPMVNAGGFAVKTLDDRWTVVTADGSLSAHFEHTIVIMQQGAEIVTRPTASGVEGKTERLYGG